MSSNPNQKSINIVGILDSIKNTGSWSDICDGCLEKVMVGQDKVVKNPGCLSLRGGHCLRMEVETALRKQNKL